MARDSSCHSAEHIPLPSGFGNFGSLINNQTNNEPTTFYNSSAQILLETQGTDDLHGHTNNTRGTLVDDVGVGTRGHVARWRVCVH
jgi:hypothetical protein